MAGPMMSGYLISRPSLFAKPVANAAHTCARSEVEAVATYSYRRAHFLAIFFLCVLVIVCLGGLYFAGDLSKFQIAFSVEESRTALRGVDDPEQLSQVLKQNPSNRILKLVALANKDSIEIDAAARRLLNETEPRDLSKRIDLTVSSRSDLEALGRDLKIAESKAATAKPCYIALIKVERDKVETDARSLGMGNDTLADFMAMIDEQHAEMTALISKVLALRVEYYGPFEKCVALLIRDFGSYKVVNGQLILSAQSSTDSYNGAAAAMATAGRRFVELEGKRTTLRQSQLNRWKNFVDR
jgi:hypothetical protein